jgi:hypothetical protein
MVRFHPIAMEVDGRKVRGEWSLMMGGRVCVRSIFGSETAEVGQATPPAAARLTLEKIVKGDRKRRAAENAAYERERAKLRRPRR